MERLWFWLISSMFAIYSMLDGFDFGAGALHVHLAKTNAERKAVLAAIAPYWDGNEVWLIAAGGSLLLAFPSVLAAGLSGFYLAMFMVLWSLTLRGVAIEFRNHVDDPLWQSFWDVVFCVASSTMPILLGVALGNVIRGIPLDNTGYFNIPLFSNFSTRNPLGVLDWYTVSMGLFVLCTLAGHGALYLAWKTEGIVQTRAARLSKPLWLVTTVMGVVCTYATSHVNPGLFANLPRAPEACVATAIFMAGLATVMWGIRRERYLIAFTGSSGFIVGILGATAGCLFPTMLRSSLRPEWSLTAYNASAGGYELRAGAMWWFLALPLVIAYFVFVFWIHSKKFKAPGAAGYGRHSQSSDPQPY